MTSYQPNFNTVSCPLPLALQLSRLTFSYFFYNLAWLSPLPVSVLSTDVEAQLVMSPPHMVLP